MHFWLELHCDTTWVYPQCSNTLGNYPKGTFSDLRVGRSTLEREAKDLGWKKLLMRGEHTPKMFCPYCVAKLKPQGRSA